MAWFYRDRVRHHSLFPLKRPEQRPILGVYALILGLASLAAARSEAGQALFQAHWQSALAAGIVFGLAWSALIGFLFCWNVAGAYAPIPALEGGEARTIFECAPELRRSAVGSASGWLLIAALLGWEGTLILGRWFTAEPVSTGIWQDPLLLVLMLVGLLGLMMASAPGPSELLDYRHRLKNGADPHRVWLEGRTLLIPVAGAMTWVFVHGISVNTTGLQVLSLALLNLALLSGVFLSRHRHTLYGMLVFTLIGLALLHQIAPSFEGGFTTILANLLIGIASLQGGLGFLLIVLYGLLATAYWQVYENPRSSSYQGSFH